MGLRVTVAGCHRRDTDITTDALSICAFVSRVVDTGGRQYLLWASTSDASTGFGEDNKAHSIFLENGEDVIGSCDWDSYVTSVLGTITDSSWFFVGMKLWNDSGTRRGRFCYGPVGGALTFETILQGFNFDNVKIQVGAGSGNTGNAGCDLEYVRIWEAALSDADFEAEFESPTIVETTDVYSWFAYAADPDATTAVEDESGNSNDMTAQGAALSVNTNAPTLTTATGPTLSGSDQIPSSLPSGSAPTAPTLGSVTGRTYKGGTFALSGLGSNRARIYGRLSAGGTRQLLVETAVGATSVLLSTLLPKTAYWIDATAYDGTTESSFSTSQTFTTRNLRIRLPLEGTAYIGQTMDGVVAQLPTTGQIMGAKIDDVTGIVVAAGSNSEFVADLLPASEFQVSFQVGANYSCAIRNATIGTWMAWNAVAEEV